MPRDDAYAKSDRLYRLRQLFEQPGQRLRTSEIASKLGITDDTVKAYIDELSGSGRLPLRKDGRYWMLAEGAHIPQLQVHLAIHEAAALFVAGRLLSQIHDERNMAVIVALTKLVDALPEPLRAHQRAMIDMAEQRQLNQPDRTAIFVAITQGWALRKRVQVLYAPVGKQKFTCLFDPYLLEPSGIGRTIYALGYCDPPDDVRTLKLERIEHAQVTDESFTVDEDFDGPRRLERAWGVMYGDGESLITVRLRFSHRVAQRVHETLWHPSQILVDTSAGCEMILHIGETLEIENWIRGWGSDCEVLEPAALRDSIRADVLRSMRLYGLTTENRKDEDNEEEDIFSSYFGGEDA